MLKILPIMLMSSAQKIYPLCRKLCPSPLQLCHSSYTVILLLMTACISMVKLQPVAHAMLQCMLLYFTYYAHEKTGASFRTMLV